MKTESDGKARRDWRDVYTEFRDRIEAGNLEPGTALPALAELARAHRLSVHGARRVVNRLVSAGLAVTWQGKGSFVSEDQVSYPIAARTRFGDNVRKQGKDWDTQVISVVRRHAPDHIRRALDLPHGGRIDQAEILRNVQHRPAMLARHSYPADAFAGILERLAETGSVTAAFRACGLDDFVRRDTRIRTRLPSGHEAHVLGIPPHQPVLVATGVNVDLRNRPVEVSESISRGDRVTLHV